MRRRLLASALALTAGLAVLAGCATVPQARPGTLSVVVGFYPIEYAATGVGGQNVTVFDLTKPGVEPHDIELTPQQVALITTADVVAYIPGLAPAIDDAVAQNNPRAGLDVTAGIKRLSAWSDGAQSCSDNSPCPYVADPHVWLDPMNEAQIARNIEARLLQLAPKHADTFSSALATFANTMSGLNSNYTSGLAVCATRTLIASHAAFGYLSQAYGLTQIGITGLNPDAEPSPERLAQVAQLAKQANVTTVYYERLVSPAVAQTLASTVGLKTAVLDPLEGKPPAGDYTTQMHANLTTLRIGQGCS